jgi:hypothetical protein
MRQSISRGYAVSATRGAPVSDLIGSSPIGVAGAIVRTNPEFPLCVWVDSGLVWLGDERAREETFARIIAGTRELEALLGRRGASLVPSSAVWDGEAARPVSCGDEHFLETAGDAEREVLCNLLRIYSPHLIALAGRASTGQGSYRLGHSGRHYAARYFSSVSPLHLDRVAREFRREAGISRIDLLDITPSARDEASGVLIRCIDAQLLAPFTRAHAIICQAMAMRARRLAREGRRVGQMPQPIVTRNRGRAVVHGLDTMFEVEAPDRQRRPSGDKVDPTYLRAEDAVLQFLIELINELPAIEASYDELLPLVLGLSCCRIGKWAPRNENDLLLHYLKEAGGKGAGLSRLMMLPLREQQAFHAELMRRFASAEAQAVKGWWEARLRAGRSYGPRGSRSREGQRPHRPSPHGRPSNRREPRADV